MALKQQIQWREPYVSTALNSKTSGIIPAGVYKGYVLALTGGAGVSISPQSDYPISSAVVDRAGYNFTVTSESVESIIIDNTAVSYYICIDALYQFGGGGYSNIVAVEESGLIDGMVILGRAYWSGENLFLDLTERNDQSIKRLGNEQYRDYAINGSFDIWQGAKTQTSSGYGSDDMWRNENNGSTKLHSRMSFLLGETFPDGKKTPRYYSRTVVSHIANSGNFVRKEYRIKGVENLSGEVVTISFRAKANAGQTISVETIQNFGTGGTPSAPVEGINVRKIALNSTFARYSITAKIPSVFGKTLGTDGKDYIGFCFWFDAGSNFNARTSSLGNQSGTFDIAEVSIKVGGVAPHVKRSQQEELELCLPYYCKSYDTETVPGSITAVGAYSFEERAQIDIHFGVDFPINMVGVPIVTIYSPKDGATGYVLDLNVNGNYKVANIIASSKRIYSIVLVTPMTAPAGSADRPSFHYTARFDL